MPTFKDKLEKAKQEGEERMAAKQAPVVAVEEIVVEEIAIEEPAKVEKPVAKKKTPAKEKAPAKKKESKTTTKKTNKNG